MMLTDERHDIIDPVMLAGSFGSHAKRLHENAGAADGFDLPAANPLNGVKHPVAVFNFRRVINKQHCVESVHGLTPAVNRATANNDVGSMDETLTQISLRGFAPDPASEAADGQYAAASPLSPMET